MTVPVHFWIPDEAPEDLEAWEPDLEPERYGDGLGHNVLELYVRLLTRGYDVTLGPRLRSRTRTVVFLPSLLERRAQLALLRQLYRQRHADILVIRSDFLVSYTLPAPVATQVMPNFASCVMANQVWLPPLPQRGLVPRDEARGSEVTTLGYMGYSHNLPASMRSAEWKTAIASTGGLWRPTLESSVGEALPRWHDFQQVDCVVCLRSDHPQIGLIRKPATKLINAWCAGAVPLIGREPGYLELANPGEDALVVSDSQDVLQAFARLRSDPQLASRLLAGAQRRAKEFELERILALWADQLVRAPLTTARVASASGMFASGRVLLRWALDASRGNPGSPVWTEPRARLEV